MAPSRTVLPLFSSPRRVLRFLRDLPDRLLHGRRRRGAIERLRTGPAPASVLFICLGNINRSPYAAAAFDREIRSRAGSEMRVRSAGLIGPGRAASEEARSIAAARGLDLNGHLSRALDPMELRETDLIVVMDPTQRRTVCRISARPPSDVVILGDLDPAPIMRRAIQDPYGHPSETFERVFARVDRCIHELANAVARSDRSRAAELLPSREP